MNRNELIADVLENMNLTKRSMMGHLQQLLRELPVSAGQLELLYFIHQHQPIAAKALAQERQLTPGAISQLTEALEQHKFITRSQTDTDRRTYMLATTEAGDKLLVTLQKRREELFRRVMRNFTEAELSAWVQIQQKVIRELEADKDALHATKKKGKP